jgi:hypothetical protein
LYTPKELKVHYPEYRGLRSVTTKQHIWARRIATTLIFHPRDSLARQITNISNREVKRVIIVFPDQEEWWKYSHTKTKRLEIIPAVKIIINEGAQWFELPDKGDGDVEAPALVVVCWVDFGGVVVVIGVDVGSVEKSVVVAIAVVVTVTSTVPVSVMSAVSVTANVFVLATCAVSVTGIVSVFSWVIVLVYTMVVVAALLMAPALIWVLVCRLRESKSASSESQSYLYMIETGQSAPACNLHKACLTLQPALLVNKCRWTKSQRVNWPISWTLEFMFTCKSAAGMGTSLAIATDVTKDKTKITWNIVTKLR